MINIYDKNEQSFVTNGLVVLNCKSCYVTEKLNGEYELELEHPFDDRLKWQQILEDNIIKADGQLFRIYRKSKIMSGIRGNARHISYDLLDDLVEQVDIRGLSGANALDTVLNNTSYTHNFTGMSDITTANNIDIEDPTGDIINKNPIETLAILQSIYGGELVRDNFNIKLLNARGQDRGVLVSYGKNIEGIKEEIDSSDVITRIKPIGAGGMTIPEKFVDSPNINAFPHPKLKPIEFSDCEDEDELRILAQQYFIKTKCDYPLANYKVDFVELSKTEEYKNYSILETVYLGDIVTVKHSRLNINLKCKVISITKNVLTNRIEQIELGDFKPNLSNTMSSIQTTTDAVSRMLTKSNKINVSYLEGAIKAATDLLISSGDGHVIQDQNGISIMDTIDKNTAQKVWRWNLNGLGYSSTGYNGPFRTAITADGHIVADFIDTGALSAGLIKTGVIKSQNGNIQISLDGDTLKIGDKLMYDGTNLTFSGGAIKWDNLDTTAQTNLTGPAGVQGVQGVQGPIGPQGPAGEPGHDWSFYANKTYINGQAIATPNFFAGTNSAAPSGSNLTGVTIDNTGLHGYINNVLKFELKSNGTAWFSGDVISGGKIIGADFRSQTSPSGAFVDVQQGSTIGTLNAGNDYQYALSYVSYPTYNYGVFDLYYNSNHAMYAVSEIKQSSSSLNIQSSQDINLTPGVTSGFGVTPKSGSVVKVNGDEVATKNWVQNNMYAKFS